MASHIYEKANGPALTVKEGEEPIEFWNALGSNQDQEQIMVTKGVVGQRKVVDYDIDFAVFDKAANSGVVPPFSVSGNDYEMCLPARRSGWERLRRKFAAGIMKDLIITSSKETVSVLPCDSPGSCSSGQNWEKNEDDNSECMSPESFSSFLVNDARKFDTISPSISPTTSDYSNSLSFSPSSSNWSDLSVLEASDPSPNPKLEKITPSGGMNGDDQIEWQTVGHDFLVNKGLKTSSIIQIVKEGEEPEQLWKHLHCFSFQNTAEEQDKGKRDII
ncbi:hypothetical protein L1987_72458 [Smallanthus sonchifolius]|uniref:Uncharacterized protein n=1 Tax=Smallanthus sonchifolius TaxID=185202 RepID=A0ACB9AV96_9ASTR|nr:hypothetical protein L1987_72458 [Smallanthus sonchifolius]